MCNVVVNLQKFTVGTKMYSREYYIPVLLPIQVKTKYTHVGPMGFVKTSLFLA